MRLYKYRKGKAKARAEAIELQERLSTCSSSYGATEYIRQQLHALGKRYGLLKEFRENGLI